MRSITPVVAIVVLLLMTVAAAGMAFLTISTYQSETQVGTERSIEQIGTSTRTQLRIESVSNGQIYLRNLGSETYSNPAFYVEGRPLNISGPSDCDPGKLCVYTVLENVTCSDGCALSMGEDMPVGTSTSVEEEELAACSTICDGSCARVDCFGTDPDCDSSGNPTIECCGNSACGSGENCTNCPNDCGACPQYTLQLEASEAWGGGNARYGESVKAEIIDGSPKIVGFGAVRIYDPMDETYASLRIWNYTGGVLSLENSTNWQVSGYYTYGGSVDVDDVDGDTEPEIVTVTGIGSSPGSEGLRIFNYSKPLLYLENSTTRSGIAGAVVGVSDVDDDGAKEIITLSEDADVNSPSKISVLNYSNFKTYSEFGPFDLGFFYLARRANDLFVYDVDEDTDKEILYVTTSSPSSCGSAPCDYEGNLNISSWDGNNFSYENSSDLGNNANGVYVANIDSDGEIEILTASGMWDGSGFPGTYDGQLIIWNFDGSNLVVEKNYTNSSITFYKVHAKDINNDSVVEIIVAGFIKDDWTNGYLSIYTWNTTDLVLHSTYDFGTDYWLASLDVYDVDGDGTDEILLLGDYLTILNYTLS